MPKHRFADLTRAVERAAKNWPQQRPATNDPQPFERYNIAAKRLVEDVEMSEPLTGKEMTRRPAPFGIRMMFRTCYIASVVAKNDNMDIGSLVDAMRDPHSFDILDNLQQTSAFVADRAEETMGLIPTDRAIADHRLERWSFTDGALTYDDASGLIEDTRWRMMQPKANGECPLRRAKQDRPLFAAVVQICERDQNLFQRSLSEDNAHARESVLPLL